MIRNVAEYCSDDGTRRAILQQFKKGSGDITDRLVVRCFENDELIHSIDCTNHSLFYAENAAENFVLKALNQ